MRYAGLAAPSYNKDRKRLAPAIIHRLDEVRAQILQDPHRRDRKRGALRQIWVEKFKAQIDQWLVAYIIDGKRDIVYFVAVGQHENFYRDLRGHSPMIPFGDKTGTVSGETGEADFIGPADATAHPR